ncbi:hypothetical protein BST61_g4951 [Cercospora zeina]
MSYKMCLRRLLKYLLEAQSERLFPWVSTLLSRSSPPLQPRNNDDQNIFIAPTGPGPPRVYDGDPVWNLNSSQLVSWTTNVTSYRIERWQQDPELAYAYSISTVYHTAIEGTVAESQSMSGDVELYTSSLTFSPICLFLMAQAQSTGWHHLPLLQCIRRDRERYGIRWRSDNQQRCK